MVERIYFLSKYLRSMRDILKNEKDGISVLNKKTKQNDKMIFSLTWNIMFIFPWSFWAFHDIPGLRKYGFSCSKCYDTKRTHDTKYKIFIKDDYLKSYKTWTNTALFEFGLAKSDIRQLPWPKVRLKYDFLTILNFTLPFFKVL